MDIWLWMYSFIHLFVGYPTWHMVAPNDKKTTGIKISVKMYTKEFKTKENVTIFIQITFQHLNITNQKDINI